jgi:ethanolamine-phosphate cytidylyltransferase
VIDPPWHLTREMIAALSISVVAHGTTDDSRGDDDDPYQVPKAMGIFHRLPSQRALTVDVVFARVNANHERLRKKVDRKQEGERDYYAKRYGFEGAKS